VGLKPGLCGLLVATVVRWLGSLRCEHKAVELDCHHQRDLRISGGLRRFKLKTVKPDPLHKYRYRDTQKVGYRDGYRIIFMGRIIFF